MPQALERGAELQRSLSAQRANIRPFYRDYWILALDADADADADADYDYDYDYDYDEVLIGTRDPRDGWILAGSARVRGRWASMHAPSDGRINGKTFPE